MLSGKGLKTRILWFINQEIERTLINLESGVISKEQAIGSLSTVYQLASQLEDPPRMKTICSILADIRDIKTPLAFVKKYKDHGYDHIDELF
jgi:hypothetical protein